MSEEHKTKCVTLPWCVIWIEDAEPEPSLGQKRFDPKWFYEGDIYGYERRKNAQAYS